MRCTVRDGRLALLQPNDKMPNKRYSKICLKGIAEIQQVYSDERIQTPMRRVGERGESKFEPISWDEAFEDIYQNFKAIQDKYGKEAIWAHIASECSDLNWVANILGCYKTTGADGANIGYGSGIDPATEFLGSTYAWATNGSRDWANSELLLVVTMAYTGGASGAALAQMTSGATAPWFWIEIVCGLAIPTVILAMASKAQKPTMVLAACILVICGVACKRMWLLLTSFIIPNVATGPGVTLGTSAAQTNPAALWAHTGSYLPTIPELLV